MVFCTKLSFNVFDLNPMLLFFNSNDLVRKRSEKSSNPFNQFSYYLYFHASALSFI